MMRATVCREAASGLLASMLVMGSRYCGGLATPPTPAGAMAVTSVACACMERLMTTSYSLAKRLVSSAVRMELSGLAAEGRPNGGCCEAVDGNGAGGRDVELKRSLPGEEERVAGSGDAGEHGVGIHVHGFDGVGHGAAPAHALAAAEVGGDGLPCGGLIEVREERIGQLDGVGVDLRFGGGRHERAGVGDDGGAAGVEESSARRRERRIEREGAAGLRSLEGDGQQIGQRIGEARRAGASGGESGKGVRIGGDDGAVTVVAALQIDADEGAVVESRCHCAMAASELSSRKKRADIEAGHGGHGGGAKELPAGIVCICSSWLAPIAARRSLATPR